MAVGKMIVTLPDDILEATRLTEKELVRELALTLFQSERLTLGQAARLCSIPTGLSASSGQPADSGSLRAGRNAAGPPTG